MNLNNLNICQISLKGNIPTIKENILKFKNYYPGFNLFIICPKNQKKIFKKNINYKNCKIINE